MKFLLDERRKHRLIGVIVLLSIVVVLLPSMFKEPNDRVDAKTNISVRLPIKPLLPKVDIPEKKEMFQSVKVAHVDIPTTSQLPHVPPTVQAKPLRLEAALDKKSALSQVKQKAKPVVKQVVSAKKIRTPAGSKKQVYAVQLGSFAVQNNAKTLVSRLRHQGYKATYKKWSGKTGDFYKVIVGQLNEKNEAKLLQKQLADALHLNGFVIKTGVS